MIVEDLALLCEDRFNETDIRIIMSDYVFAMQDDNDTAAALKNYFSGEVRQKSHKSSALLLLRKYGGVSFHEDGRTCWARRKLFWGTSIPNTAKKSLLLQGCRVLLLALYDGDLGTRSLRLK